MRSLAEIRFRLKQEAANVLLWLFPPSPGATDVAVPFPRLPDPAAVAAVARGTSWADELISRADEILRGRVPLLGTSIETGIEPAWRRDYLSGRETPAIFFRRIPYLDSAIVGDHKNIWELNRHQHLVLVSQAFALSKDPRYSRFVMEQLRHWFRENPFQCGINWSSSLEVGFRALSWLWILHLLGPEMDPSFRAEFLTQLYRHGMHLEFNLSLYFSPNTHLLGEALALHAIGWLIPSFDRSARWRTTGRSILVEQFRKQVHGDGGYFEQSTYYHLYALDMFLFHHTLEPLPEPGRLEAMAEFLTAMLGADGTLPFLGDDDGGRLFFPFGPRNGFARATLATCSVLLGRGYFGFSESDLLEQALWWLGPGVLQTAVEIKPPPASKSFPQTGIVSVRSDDVHVLFDAGPFGPWSGGHSHSDTLSLVVSAGEREILIDPGTYTYLGDPAWRDSFRGSAAHNTIRVNGRDQADPAGPFRWIDKPGVELLLWQTGPERDVAEASCSYAGFRHQRRVSFHKSERMLAITDVVEGNRPDCLIEQFWHPGERVTPAGRNQWRIGEKALLTLDPNAECELLEGWRSDALASKHPAPVIRAWMRADLPAELKTTLDVGRSGRSEATPAV